MFDVGAHLVSAKLSGGGVTVKERQLHNYSYIFNFHGIDTRVLYKSCIGTRGFGGVAIEIELHVDVGPVVASTRVRH